MNNEHESESVTKSKSEAEPFYNISIIILSKICFLDIRLSKNDKKKEDALRIRIVRNPN